VQDWFSRQRRGGLGHGVPRTGRLVQSPSAARNLRRHATGRTRARPLLSTHRPHRGRSLDWASPR